MVVRTALVTGANRGIGLEICRQLAQKDIRVILTGRNVEGGQRAAQTLQKDGLTVVYHPLDVADPASVETIRQMVERDYESLDILVNNAAIYPDEDRSVFDLSVEALQETLNINTVGPFLLCKAFVPTMCQRGYGRVVNVTSGMGDIHQMGGYTAAYKMSKAALNALTRVVASETRAFKNVKVNAVDPGWVQSDMGGRSAPRTLAQGADTPVWLATLPDDGPTDGYFYDRKQYEW